MMPPDTSVATLLHQRVAQAIAQAGGWLPFDRFMALALYAPGLGYYSGGLRKFGVLPQSGSDFVTAPELSPLFGQALAAQVAQALAATGTSQVWEFGAGTGALAAQLLQALRERGQPLSRYTIVDLSGSLRARQQATLAAWGDTVQWADTLPERLRGVIVGNELLDAMPVQLLVRQSGQWYERGVALAAPDPARPAPAFIWAERPTALRLPVEIDGEHDYLSEIHPQAQAFIATLAQRLQAGAAFFIDYGFPQSEYYHPQRDTGTLVCHRAHRVDDDPLTGVGFKDMTAHVNFSGIALAAQQAGLEVLGYTSQGRFLLNCGLPALLDAASLPVRAQAMKLVNEHEMGELFKVIGLHKPQPGQPGWPALGFAQGDRTHRL